MLNSTPRVLKFGGSSLGHADRLSQVVDLIAIERERGPLAVVVSAFGDTTDELIAATDAARKGEAAVLSRVDRISERARAVVIDVLARRSAPVDAIAGIVDEELAPLRALLADVVAAKGSTPAIDDRILATGELLAARLVSAVLSAVGVASERVDARSWVVTDENHGDARVDLARTKANAAALASAWAGPSAPRLTVHTGFIGATPDGATTTLGRNGSDYTAALLSAALGAGALTLCTDVSGVMTADPALVREAYPVPHLSYREALELTGLGLRMLHPRTVLPLLEAGIPLRIRHTMRPDEPGTLVDDRGLDDPERPTCVASLENMALVSVEGTLRTATANLAPRTLGALAAAGIPFWLAAPAPQGNGVAIVVRADDAAATERAVEGALATEMASGALGVPRVAAPVSVVTLVGEAMGRKANVAGRFFGAIGAIGVNVAAASQGATSRAISCVVDGRDTAPTVQAVHSAFNLATERVHLVVLGKGTVGGHLLQQIAAERDALSSRHDVDLRVVGLVDRRASWFDPSATDAAQARDLLRASREPSDLLPLLDRLARLPVPILVDCTAADDMDRAYAEALSRGIHVVTANKKPFALPAARRDALFTRARNAHRSLRYETTVGASLPVVETLQNLVRTGDAVAQIEGSLSGTLGYLANAVSAGERLSDALRAARDRGYTEPHPRDDLSGIDAARKALILAREVGLAVELEDISVEPFVPAELFAHDDVEAFFHAVTAHDEPFARHIRGLRAEGRVLRYLATITTPSAGAPATVRVGPVGIPLDHPAARLRGTEALIAFRTERYRDYPLVVQGAGAGGSVTAAGVLADVLAIARARRRS